MLMARLESQQNLFEKTTKMQINSLGEQMRQLKLQLKTGFSASPLLKIKTITSVENSLRQSQFPL